MLASPPAAGLAGLLVGEGIGTEVGRGGGRRGRGAVGVGIGRRQRLRGGNGAWSGHWVGTIAAAPPADEILRGERVVG